MTPLEIYQKNLTQGFRNDPNQAQAILHLQRLYEELTDKSHNVSNPLKKWTQKIFSQEKKAIHGVYLWGSVGVGKTWLMDIFFESLPIQRKLRMHFHRFMQFVHQELTQLQGQENPLKIVAKHFSAQADVICFDEFLVNDIVDAMLLANLLAALFDENITLVTTANVEPDLLYRNGLQRSRFLPAITLIKNNLETIHLPTQIDYRVQTHEKIGTYFFPINDENKKLFQAGFEKLTQGKKVAQENLLIEGRLIKTEKLFDGMVWFDFQQLCSVPRSQLDYLEIAERFHTVFLSGVHKIASDESNTVRYLINLIDIFYDKHVKLIVLSAVPIGEIYVEGKLIFEFRRTRSRLQEMQSEEYWKRDAVRTISL
jgi:cell division protein ZapE